MKAEYMPGRNAGKIVDAEDKDLRYWANRLAKELEQNPGNDFADKDRAILEGISAEISRRGGGADPQGRPGGSRQRPARRSGNGNGNGSALASRNSDTLLAGATHDPKAVTARLRKAAEAYHLVSPATSCDGLPPGCGVAMSLVYVDPNADRNGPGEVYSLSGGKVGLSGTTLKRVAAAAGIDWDPTRSGRLDDGRDPHYCHFRAVGTVKNFDGSTRTVSGEVEMDLRDGSPQLEAIRGRAKSEDSKTANQIRDMRLFVLRHAETKAKLRAVTDLGIKRSYFPSELEKPFAVARLMWTGQTDDPVLKAKAFEMQHAAMTGASAALYGPPQGGAPMPPARQMSSGHAPPPVGSRGAAMDDDFDDYDRGDDPDAY